MKKKSLTNQKKCEVTLLATKLKKKKQSIGSTKRNIPYNISGILIVSFSLFYISENKLSELLGSSTDLISMFIYLISTTSVLYLVYTLFYIKFHSNEIKKLDYQIYDLLRLKTESDI